MKNGDRTTESNVSLIADLGGNRTLVVYLEFWVVFWVKLRRRKPLLLDSSRDYVDRNLKTAVVLSSASNSSGY